MNRQQWEAELSDIVPYVREIRREIHQYPELSGQEQQTKSRIIRELQKDDIDAVGFSDCEAVMGVLKNGDGPCVAIRADMDALPIDEPEGLPFASRNPGVMHACGHDVHMALALGSAAWFSKNRDRWHGIIKWLFEPQEETTGGGQIMVRQGCMDNPKVDCVIGQHVNPRYPAGTFFCKSGYVSGSSDEVYITVNGQSTHGAYPEGGIDAIVIAAQVVSALQTVSSRNVSPFDPIAFTLGMVEGGTAGNVVCGQVRLTGTLRTLSDHIRAKVKERICSIACSTAEGMGGSCSVEFHPGYGAVYNDPGWYARIEECARDILGEDHIVIREAPSLGVESFSFFMEHTPGVYYDIGSGISTPLHSPTFMVDESVLFPGLALQCAAALSVLNGSCERRN